MAINVLFHTRQKQHLLQPGIMRRLRVMPMVLRLDFMVRLKDYLCMHPHRMHTLLRILLHQLKAKSQGVFVDILWKADATMAISAGSDMDLPLPPMRFDMDLLLQRLILHTAVGPPILRGWQVPLDRTCAATSCSAGVIAAQSAAFLTSVFPIQALRQDHHLRQYADISCRANAIEVPSADFHMRSHPARVINHTELPASLLES